MPMAPMLNLRVTDGKLFANYGWTSEIGWRISLTVKLASFRDELILATGEDIKDVEMHVNFKSTSAKIEEWLATESPESKIIGQMHYFDNNPAILTDVFIPPEAMERLLDFAVAGRFPQSLTLDCEGMKYGWQPDGSGKAWDNKAKSVLNITNVSFEMPSTATVEGENGVIQTATTPVAADLLPTLKETAKMTKWMLYAVAIIAGSVLFKAWS